ncbi:TIGR04282 family arsenosugar biosynthesis glycosyltransferase [soil metagenome]
MKEALIIFVRNLVLGKVKTRLAKTIGDEMALQVYKQLLLHTKTITKDFAVTRFVFYADHINEQDIWDNNFYNKSLQQGSDLGARMSKAFSELFSQGFKHIVIIGSDCYELTTEILQDAFAQLQHYDMVAGPSFDGGYYLLGLNKLHNTLFENKAWSTDNVMKATLQNADALDLSYYLLPVLNDIDDEDDLKNSDLII